jgi:arsenite-transporting ATPase
MPPTALALKFFNLPDLSLLWLEKLLHLRTELVKKREIITKIKFGKKEIETDKVLVNLSKQTENYKKIKNIFNDRNNTLINVVMNPDKLSLSETRLIINRLTELNLSVYRIVINKYKKDFYINNIKKQFSNYKIKLLPLENTPLIGVEPLKNYLNKNKPSLF